MNDISLVIGIIGIAIMATILIVWSFWTFRMIKNKKSGNRLVISADENINVNITITGPSGGGGAKPPGPVTVGSGGGPGSGAWTKSPIIEPGDELEFVLIDCEGRARFQKKPKRLPLAATGIGNGGDPGKVTGEEKPEFQKKPEITPLNEKKRKVEVRILNKKERFLIAKISAVNYLKQKESFLTAPEGERIEGVRQYIEYLEAEISREEIKGA